VPANREHLRLTRIKRGDNFVEISDGRDRLLVYFFDHVAFL